MSAAEPDRFFGGSLRLFQTDTGHRVGTDAVLLAAAAPDIGAGYAVDLGAGVGAVGLRVAQQSPQARVLLVDSDAVALDVARRNGVLNDLGARVEIVAADVLGDAAQRRAAGLAAGVADLVATNPPFGAARSVRASPDARRAAAHVMPDGGLPRWVAAAADLLKPKGALVMIHRADSLAEVLAALAASGFGSVLLRPVQPKADAAASRLLARAAKGGRAPLTLLPPLVLHQAGGAFTAEADAIHRGGARIGW